MGQFRNGCVTSPGWIGGPGGALGAGLRDAPRHHTIGTMFSYLTRMPRFALLALAVLGLAVPALAQVVPSGPRAIQTAEDPWLYKGSDIVQDSAWRFGRLPNGVRYAVRKNGVPPARSRCACGSMPAR